MSRIVYGECLVAGSIGSLFIQLVIKILEAKITFRTKQLDVFIYIILNIFFDISLCSF